MNGIKSFADIQTIINKYGKKLFVLTGIIGIMLIFISEQPENKPTELKETSLESYRINLQNELSTLLSRIEGAGEVQVMITLESGEENIYAWQEKTSDNQQSVSAQVNNQTSQNSTYENRIVTVGSGSDKQALIEKTMEPVVQGVVVVCKGADNIKTVSDITNAVSVVLNISSNRICVIKMQ